MKTALLSTLVLLAGVYANAADPVDPPAAPSIVGTWSLSALACSSGAPLSGGIKIGEDTMKATFAENNTFSEMATVAGCDMAAKGTYKLDGNILTTTVTEAKTCKDVNPVPMNETKTCFVAHLSDTQAVSVTTGDKAAAVCPAGDALISTFTKDVAPM